MTTETLPTRQVHDEVDWAERNLRLYLINIKDQEDVKLIRYLVAKLKFLTWSTLTQGPEVPEGYMVINWSDMDWFLDQADGWEEEALEREICDLMPAYLYWLSTIPNFNKKPGFEIWRRFALDW